MSQGRLAHKPPTFLILSPYLCTVYSHLRITVSPSTPPMNPILSISCLTKPATTLSVDISTSSRRRLILPPPSNLMMSSRPLRISVRQNSWTHSISFPTEIIITRSLPPLPGRSITYDLTQIIIREPLPMFQFVTFASCPMLPQAPGLMYRNPFRMRPSPLVWLASKTSSESVDQWPIEGVISPSGLLLGTFPFMP